MGELHFQYCQKIVVLSKDKSKVLLCKRKGETDYNDVFSFIGGKMETSDASIIQGLKREKDEEVGEKFQIMIYPTFSSNLLFKKEDGNSMILPHYLAIYKEGDINLNEEYSEYQWVEINKLDEFEPKIANIPEIKNSPPKIPC
jgi:ADP-ribose pyrophosphatase YjhB (NUDIX family)|tara:strand:- start:1884 stop:2312 length:429 start_codon:yes stop_codon:yes gene_type:complete